MSVCGWREEGGREREEGTDGRKGDIEKREREEEGVMNSSLNKNSMAQIILCTIFK